MITCWCYVKNSIFERLTDKPTNFSGDCPLLETPKVEELVPPVPVCI